MKKTEALSKWSDACSASKVKEQIVRDGNWTTLARALRHFNDENAAIEESGELNGDTVIKVTPSEIKPDKAPVNCPQFLLVVR
jgi:hypothetical protein